MIKYWILVVGIFVSLLGAFSKDLSPPKSIIPIWTLLLDAEDSKELPRNFRTTRNSLPNNYDASDLLNLNMSGSGQFSALQFKTMIEYLENFGFSSHQILIVDLREEPHAFINGNAFTWYAKEAWWTQNNPVTLVIENEKQRLARLKFGESILIKGIAYKDNAGDVKRLVDYSYVIASLLTEGQVVTEAGAHYVRLPVTDHMRPDDKDVEQFLSLIKKLSSQMWVHFHCRAGRGRTSTFMIMYDMIRNPHLSKKAIIDRQVQLGSLDVRCLSSPLKAHKHPNEKLRKRFVDLFYDYVQDPEGYNKNSWTKWNMQRYMKFLKSE